MANTNRSDIHELFLALVRLGIGAEAVSRFRFQDSSTIDWEALQNLAAEQGLSAIVLDGIERLPAEMRPAKVELLQWIGEVLQSESVYAAQWKAACEMSQVFKESGIRTYVLKGFVVSECYPKPEHRVSVDLDCFLVNDNHDANDNLGSLSSTVEAANDIKLACLAESRQNSTKLKSQENYNQNLSRNRDLGHFEAWELGNQLMEKNGFEVDRSFYKNSTITLPGLTVENHQFMNAVRGSKRLKRLERLFQRLFNDNRNDNRFEGTSIYRPPVMVSALFLIEHAYAHFLHEGLTWRMVLDWVMFSKKHKKEINWNEFGSYIDEFGFRKFYDVFNEIGQDAFGNDSSRIGELENSTNNSQLVTGSKRSTINSKLRNLMIEDIWAPLDLHEFHGVKGKIALAGNEIRAAWKYKYFSADTMIGDLFNRVRGFLFERHPKL